MSSDRAGETLTALLEKRIDRQKNLKTQRSYDKMLISYIWLSVRTHGPHVKYFPVRRSHSVNKYILFTRVRTGGIDRM